MYKSSWKFPFFYRAGKFSICGDDALLDIIHYWRYVDCSDIECRSQIVSRLEWMGLRTKPQHRS